MEIGYQTDDPGKPYGKAIRAASDLEELKTVIAVYKRVAEDAFERVLQMTERDFKQFRKDLPLFRRENLPDEEMDRINKLWGDIVLPRKMMYTSLVSNQFNAPWGTAFIRMEELGWPWEKQKGSKK